MKNSNICTGISCCCYQTQFKSCVSHARDKNTVNDYVMIKERTKNSNIQIAMAIIDIMNVQYTYKNNYIEQDTMAT